MKREPLNVTSPSEFHNWLVHNLGGPALPGFYARGGDLVRVPRMGQAGYEPLSGRPEDDDGPAQVRPADKETVRAVIARSYDTFITRRHGDIARDVPVLPPGDPVGVFLGGIHEADGALPRLDGVVHAPFVRPDGTIRTAPGYDESTRLLHLPPSGLKLPPIPEHPTRAQVTTAATRLSELVSQFPFVTIDDRASYIGSIILGPLLRPLVRPPYAITALSAHMAGSGKTLLAAIGRILHGGVFRSEPQNADDEIRKLITTLLMNTSGPLIVLDNLAGTFRSPQFAAMATSATWSDRALGSNKHIEVPNDRQWILTGNNIALGGDMVRRVPIWSRIDADRPDPHLRNGFRIPDMESHVREHRGQLLADALLLVRAWIVEGRPLEGEARHDSFGTWIRSVSGILAVAGIDGEFASAEVAAEASPVGSEDDEDAAFLEAIAARFGSDQPFTSRDIGDVIAETVAAKKVNAKAAAGDNWSVSRAISCEDKDLLDAVPGVLADKVNAPSFNRSLGMWLGYRVGQWKGTRALGQVKSGSKGTSSYKIREYSR